MLMRTLPGMFLAGLLVQMEPETGARLEPSRDSYNKRPRGKHAHRG